MIPSSRQLTDIEFQQLTHIEVIPRLLARLFTVTPAPSVHLKIKMATINGKRRCISMISENIWDCENSLYSCSLSSPICQSVVYGSAQSAPQQIKSGVPQGSILGPILFSIYINDLPNCLLQSKILLYEDDAVLLYADSNIGNISTVLNKDLKQLQSWTHLDKLCIHPVKTECVLFGTQQRYRFGYPVRWAI